MVRYRDQKEATPPVQDVSCRNGQYPAPVGAFSTASDHREAVSPQVRNPVWGSYLELWDDHDPEDAHMSRDGDRINFTVCLDRGNGQQEKAQVRSRPDGCRSSASDTDLYRSRNTNRSPWTCRLSGRRPTRCALSTARWGGRGLLYLREPLIPGSPPTPHVSRAEIRHVARGDHSRERLQARPRGPARGCQVSAGGSGGGVCRIVELEVGYQKVVLSRPFRNTLVGGGVKLVI